ncbi:MAG: hypothetical protein ACSLFQ_08155 [Thermoanaerobaculia bacterium]
MSAEPVATPCFPPPRRALRPAFHAPRPARAFASVLLTLILSLPASAAPQPLPPLVEKALETMETSDQEGYAYRMSKVEGGATSIAQFDPTRPAGEVWSLLQKDGRKPTTKEIESFRKERAEREAKQAKQRKDDAKKKGRADEDLRALIAPGSVQLVAETAERASYRFRMQSDDEDTRAMVDSIRGTLVISKAAPYVESLDLASTGEMRPVTGVKISEFHLTLTFHAPDAHGKALPATVRSVVKGRAMLVKKIDQDLSVSFTEYARRRLPGAPAVTAR